MTITQILSATHPDPFSILGPHLTDDGLVIRAFRPEASDMDAVNSETGEIHPMRMIHSDGLFELTLPEKRIFPYKLRAFDYESNQTEQADPYSFGSVLGEMDAYLFREGNHYDLHKRLGAHPASFSGVSGMVFAVWAPNARRVSVVGDFNRWDGRVHVMRHRVEAGVWEIFLPGVGLGVHYKYEIAGADGRLVLKSDPFAFFSQNGTQTSSITWDLSVYQWNDAAWEKERAARNLYESPMCIYEVHAGSWKRVPEEGGRSLSYRELAEQLIPHAKNLGFTHIQLMPLAEYPFDGSWGYQICGYFSPTSRFGNPDDFRYFVDQCHQNGLGVLLDWVPAHFPKDDHGLARFDGSHLYEHADPRQGEHQDWGTLIFNYGRNEVANFLISNALFWLEEYHIDGLRVDAVASMIYLDYSRREGEWIPNHFGGRENLEAIAFLRRMNEVIYARHPGCCTIAEESTSFSGVSRPTSEGGLGFGFKWNMGWMNDTLNYFHKDPIHRAHHHNEATFSLVYAWTENFILVLSHDEVVHGKGSLINKMPGDRWQKFANLRLLYSWMYAHPGKKLLFMGGEFGQWDEWKHGSSLDWHLSWHGEHAGLMLLVKDLNHLYTQYPALHSRDHSPEGYVWLEPNAWADSFFSFQRRSAQGDILTVLVNATPVPRHGIRVGLPGDGAYEEVFNSDAAVYGGGNVGNHGIHAQEIPWNGQSHSAEFTLPPLATVIVRKV